MNDFLSAYFNEIITDPASSSMILGGGYGIYLKRSHVIRGEAIELFSNTDAAGWREAARSSDVALDHDLIWPTLAQALGIE